MKKQGKGGIWWLLLVLVAVAGLLIGYWIGKDRVIDKEAAMREKKILITKEKTSPEDQESKPEAQEAIVIKEIKRAKTPIADLDCDRIEKDIQEFFGYLNKKDYIREVLGETRAYDHFKNVLARLSSNPPIPAGEGIDPMIIIQNIFHFFRVLEKKDLNLIKEIMKNEADSLEVNLDLFYKWFLTKDRCPDKDGIKPSFEVLYRYAGFLLNSIGGRAYLYRRPATLRLLVSYYCLLIIHEADKQGKNTYGIDIFPRITPLAHEISNYPDFHFADDYIQQLTELQNYYLQKR